MSEAGVPPAEEEPETDIAGPARLRPVLATAGYAAEPRDPAPLAAVPAPTESEPRADFVADIDTNAAEPRDPGTADFRVRCPDCGPQLVAIADVRFVQTGDGAEANRYMFTCPECGGRVRRPAGPELAEILKSSGVATLALHRGPGQAL